MTRHQETDALCGVTAVQTVHREQSKHRQTCSERPPRLIQSRLHPPSLANVLAKGPNLANRVPIPIYGHHLRQSFPPFAGPLCPSQTLGVLQSALRGHRRQQGPKAGGAPARSLPLQRPHCGRVKRLSSVMLFVQLRRIFKAAYLVATAAMHHRLALPVSSPSLLLCRFITGGSSAISFNNR